MILTRNNVQKNWLLQANATIVTVTRGVGYRDASASKNEYTPSAYLQISCILFSAWVYVKLYMDIHWIGIWKEE